MQSGREAAQSSGTPLARHDAPLVGLGCSRTNRLVRLLPRKHATCDDGGDEGVDGVLVEIPDAVEPRAILGLLHQLQQNHSLQRGRIGGVLARPEARERARRDGNVRIGKFGLTLEPTKTKLVEFGRFAQRHAGKHGRSRPETIYFLGFTLYCTRNRKGNFKVGMRTEKTRLRRGLMSLQELMRRIRHDTISDQVDEINAVLRGHYAYYGIAGNIRALLKVYRAVERYWHRMLCSRSWAGAHLTWDAFHQIQERMPLQRPKLQLPYRALQALAVQL